MAEPIENIEWASQQTDPNDIIEPPLVYKQDGWQRPPDAPKREYFNWWQMGVYKWIQYLTGRFRPVTSGVFPEDSGVYVEWAGSTGRLGLQTSGARIMFTPNDNTISFDSYDGTSWNTQYYFPLANTWEILKAGDLVDTSQTTLKSGENVQMLRISNEWVRCWGVAVVNANGTSRNIYLHNKYNHNYQWDAVESIPSMGNLVFGIYDSDPNLNIRVQSISPAGIDRPVFFDFIFKIDPNTWGV